MIDELNCNGQRNSNECPDYSYNCFGYACRTFAWSTPYFSDCEPSHTERVRLGLEYHHSLDEIYDNIFNSDVNFFKRVYGKNIEFFEYEDEAPENCELVAYRFYVSLGREEDEYDGDYDFDDEDWDTDFHFRVRRNGEWSEKCGSMPIRDCDIDDPWETSDGYTYDSKVIFFSINPAFFAKFPE